MSENSNNNKISPKDSQNGLLRYLLGHGLIDQVELDECMQAQEALGEQDAQASISGVLVAHRTHIMEDHGHPPAWLLHEFLSRVYPEAGEIPREVIVEEQPTERAMIEQDLAERRGGAVTLLVPQRGEKRRLVEMAVDNARQTLNRRVAGERDIDATLAQLGRALKLPERPAFP